MRDLRVRLCAVVLALLMLPGTLLQSACARSDVTNKIQFGINEAKLLVSQYGQYLPPQVVADFNAVVDKLTAINQGIGNSTIDVTKLIADGMDLINAALALLPPGLLPGWVGIAVDAGVAILEGVFTFLGDNVLTPANALVKSAMARRKAPQDPASMEVIRKWLAQPCHHHTAQAMRAMPDGGLTFNEAIPCGSY